MGKWFKLSILVISAIVLIVIIAGAFIGISNMNKENSASQQSSAVKNGKAEYDKIRVGDAKTGEGGMTIAEVEKILGTPTTQTNSKSGNVEMKVYTFPASAGPNSILVTFVNGHVAGKTQTGLE